MSKDRYSSNHTVEVNEGEGTYTVDADLSITGTTTAADLTFTGTLDGTAGTATLGDVDVQGDLTTQDIDAQDITADTISRTSHDVKYLNYTATSFVLVGDWSNNAIFTQNADSAGDHIILTSGETWKGSHSLSDLPNGGVIDNLFVRYQSTVSSGYNVTGEIWRRNKLSGTADIIVGSGGRNGNVEKTSGTANAFTVASQFNILHTVDNQLYTYWLLLSINAGSGTMNIYDSNLDVNVTDFD